MIEFVYGFTKSKTGKTIISITEMMATTMPAGRRVKSERE